MDHRELTIANRKRIVTLENHYYALKDATQTYDFVILLTRLGIAEQTLTKLTKRVMDLRQAFDAVKDYQDKIIQWGGYY